MAESPKLLWNLYAGAVGALTAMAVNGVLSRVWKVSTGEDPPAPGDPNVTFREAVGWAVASAAGLALASVVMNRLAAKSWERMLGAPVPGRRVSQPAQSTQ